jgi:Spy/CpxP family protein refolding chaperone
MSPKPLVLILALALGPLAHAQASPYAGQQSRAIKALSDEERAGLLSGEGMGYAKAAELNRYPGPGHVIELAQQLRLSGAQLEASKTLLMGHKATARRLGAAIVDAERALDETFSSGNADEVTVRRLTAEIGKLQAELRFEHLRAHLVQTALLQPDQITRYVELRGYGGGARSHGAPSHGTHKH